MKKGSVRSAGTVLKVCLFLFGFVFIFGSAIVFKVFDVPIEWLPPICIQLFGYVSIVRIYWIFVVVFSIIAILLPLKVYGIAQELRRILIKLTNIKEEAGQDRQKLCDSYEKYLSKNKTVCSIWKDYKATFIDSTKKEYSHFRNRTRSNADLYFNAEEIVSYIGTKLPTVDLLKIVSGTFVGIGILGTFIGFSQSLSGGIDIQDQNQLNVIVDGLKIAFNTSIFGLLSSITYNFLIANPFVQLLNERAKFLSDALDDVFYISDEECMRTLGEIVFETKESLASSISNMSNKVAETIMEGRQAFTAELNKTTDTLKEVSLELGKTPDSIKVMNKELNSSIEIAKENNQIMMDSAIDSIKKNIETLFNNFSTRFDSASLTMANSMESLNELPEQFSKLLFSSSEQFKTNLEDVMTHEKNAFSLLIEDSKAKIRDSLDESANNNIANTKAMLEATKTEFDGVAESMKKSFSDCTNKATDEFRSIIIETKTQLIDYQDGIARAIANSIEQINSIYNKLSLLASDYSKMEESLGSVSNSMKEAEKDFSNSIKAVFEEVPNKVYSLVENLAKATISVNSVMDSIVGMKELPDKVNNILKDFIKTTNQLDISYNTTMDKIENLYNMVKFKEGENGKELEKYAEKLELVTRSMESREGEYINLGVLINENFSTLFSKISKLASVVDEKGMMNNENT